MKGQGKIHVESIKYVSIANVTAGALLAESEIILFNTI